MIFYLLNKLSKDNTNFLKSKNFFCKYNDIPSLLDKIDLSFLKQSSDSSKRTIVILNVKDILIYILLFLKLWKENFVIVPSLSWDFKVLLSLAKKYKIGYIITDDRKFKSTNSIQVTSKEIYFFDLGSDFNCELGKSDFLLMFTSGTTSLPKLVRLSYSNVFYNIRNISKGLDISSVDYGAIMLPLDHGYALIGQLLVSLYNCTSIYFLHYDLISNYTKVLKSENISIVWTVTAISRLLIRFGGICHNVRIFSTAGAPFPFEIISSLRIKFPNSNMMNNYGCTEASPRISWIFDDDPNFIKHSVGKAMQGTLVKVKNGRLAFKGKGIMLGYLGQKQRSKNDFFITNDLGYIDNNGYIFITGRSDEQLNLSGKKINLLALRQFISDQKEVISFETKYIDNDDGKMLIYINSDSLDILDFNKKIISNFNISSSSFEVIIDNNLIEFQRFVKH